MVIPLILAVEEGPHFLARDVGIFLRFFSAYAAATSVQPTNRADLREQGPLS